jgi:hypothetical protein
VGAKFSATVQIGHGAYPASYTMGIGSFLRVNRPGRGVKPPTLASVKVKERIELYLRFPYGPLWPVVDEHYICFYFFKKADGDKL